MLDLLHCSDYPISDRSMDWYFRSGVDDLVVPRDQEPLDRLPSPNSWSQWGVSASESFKSMNKYFTTQPSSLREGHNFNGKRMYEEVDMDLSALEEEHSSNSNVYQGFQEGSLQQDASSCETPDYQLNDFAGTYQTDDIFLSSLLEEDPTSMDNLRGSFNFVPEFEYGVLPADLLSEDMIIESDYNPSHSMGMGSSKYLKTHAFSPSVDWGHGEVATLHTPHNSRQQDNPPLKAKVAKFAASSELEIRNGHVNEETSLEEFVLHELESVMAQLSEKTKICFRDALYRLAQNSKQPTVDHSQNGELIPEKLPSPMVHDETLRLENTKTMESETNAIDRTVADLMFSKMDCGAPDLPAAASLNFKQEANATTGQCNYCSSQPKPPQFPRLASSDGDAEVPIFG